MDVAGKTVLITGGGSGIGLELAKVFTAEGATVIACGRSLDKLETAKREIPGLHVATCDVTDEGQIKSLLEHCNTEFGGVDVLVNNAGVYNGFDIAKGDHPLEHQISEVDIDFNGPVRMVHHFLPGLLERPQATIVNVTSGLAFVPYVAGPVYSATKAAGHSWTRSLRKQLADTNVQVVELMPPLVDTELVAGVEGIPKMAPEKLAARFMKSFKRGRREIKPGLSSVLAKMNRIAPGFIFNRIN